MNTPETALPSGARHDDMWLSAAARRKRRRSRIAVHVVGIFAYAAALGFGLVGALLVMFLTSFHGDAPTTGDRMKLVLGLLVVAGAVSSVPAMVGIVARQKHTAALPWFLLAAITVVYTVGISFSTRPTPGVPGF